MVIKFNINHTVDASEPENFPIGESADQKPDGKLESKPQFEVDIVRNDTTLSFTCSILSTEPTEGEYGINHWRYEKPFAIMLIFGIFF